MPRRLTGVLICLLVSVVGWTQGESALLQTGEFQRKVQVAKALGMDTLPTFKVQWEHYRSSWKFQEKGKEDFPKTTLQRSEWIRLTVLTRRIAQQANTRTTTDEKRLMDSLYTVANQEGNFEDLALKYSHDASQGKPVWMPKVYLLKEWNDGVEATEQGKVSRPFLSPEGIHMLMWTAREYREAPSNVASDMQVVEEELHDALLVAALEKKYRAPVTYTEDELDDWFKSHRKEYTWDLPHYRGVVVHCKDKKAAKRIRKALKKQDFAGWKKLAERGNGDSQNTHLECGLFPIGTNKYVDKLVFKCGDFEPVEGLPYTFVMGKALKKGPETYRDVEEKVVQDFVNAHKNDWLDVLQQK